ncbi:MAG TPA: hypothetical protein VFE62_04105 [Gemmataceae bacterium]|nr:hypothetical protein [Gemmataceae bacterium]
MSDSPKSVLCWPKRLLSADDLRRHLAGQREVLLLPKTVITPLAADELRSRGIRVLWDAAKEMKRSAVGSWLYAQERADGAVAAAIQALARDGIMLTLHADASARQLALAIGKQPGAVLFCSDPATACCIANKIAGIRAGAVCNNAQVLRVQQNLGANLFAIEIPGPTYFELRQMLRTITSRSPKCPDALKELDGHAHR